MDNYNNGNSYESNYHSSNYNSEGNTDELSFSNMSTRDYMNMMAQQGNMNYNKNYGYDYSYQTYQNSFENTADKENKTKKNKTKSNSGAKSFLKKVAVFIAFGIIFGGAAAGTFVGVTRFLDKDNKSNTELTKSDEDIEDIKEALNSGDNYEIPGTAVVTDNQVDSQSLDVSDIAESAMPSVVAITIKSIQEYNAGFFGQTYEFEAEGSGSGIIIGENDEELLIVTNNHVVSDADTVTVSFIDDEVYEAKVKGTDSSSDLAIIVVELDDLSESTLSQIRIATIGNSDDIKVGEQVVAIGNALGYGQSVTTGIVSAKGRTNDTNSTTLIQTDAAINPGNSGGALLNMKGEVIGINQSKYADTQVEGMCYAIPITEVEDIINNLMNRETREKVPENEKGYLGIQCQTISEEASYMYGMPTGVLVVDYTENSMAKKSGLKKNSIIISVDGQTILSTGDLTELLEYYRAGETVPVTFMYIVDDEYQEKTVNVTLSENPEK